MYFADSPWNKGNLQWKVNVYKKGTNVTNIPDVFSDNDEQNVSSTDDTNNNGIIYSDAPPWNKGNLQHKTVFLNKQNVWKDYFSLQIKHFGMLRGVCDRLCVLLLESVTTG